LSQQSSAPAPVRYERLKTPSRARLTAEKSGGHARVGIEAARLELTCRWRGYTTVREGNNHCEGCRGWS